MTREEAIDFGEMFLEVNVDSKNSSTYKFVYEAVKLFKQEPCEDAIRRQAVLDAIQKLNIPEDMCVFEIISHIEVAIATLPPVAPQPKMGHWKLDTLKIRAFGTKNETYDYSVYCDNCGYTWDYTTDKKGSLVSNFCPNCGLKMESMEE